MTPRTCIAGRAGGTCSLTHENNETQPSDRIRRGRDKNLEEFLQIKVTRGVGTQIWNILIPKLSFYPPY